MDFSIDAFNRTYSAKPLQFKEATSPHFKCKYTYRDDGAVFQFEPTIIPTRKDFISKVQNALPKIVGDDRAKQTTVELVKDDMIDRGESVYVLVPGFTSETLVASEMLAKKLLTATHDSLS